MASATPARSITIGLLLSCAAFGAYGTLGASAQNGLLDVLGRSSGYQAEEKYFLGGPLPHKTAYTGIGWADDHLVALNGFFVLVIDGPAAWDVTLAYWCLMAEVCAAWVFMAAEGRRCGNQGRVVNWTGSFGVVMQNITFALTAPIYFIIYILTSPVSSSSSPTPESLLVNDRDIEFLPYHTALSFIIPAVLMSLPSPSVLSPAAHYNWLSIWQVFPITHTLLSSLHRLAYGTDTIAPQPVHDIGSKEKNRRAVLRAHRFALYLCLIPRTIALAVALTPAALITQLLKPVFEQVTLASLFLPYWPWDSPSAGDPASAAGKPELAKLFLQWDVASGGAALLVWAVYVYLVTVPNKSLLRDVVPKVLIYGVFGGPVAVATVLVMERDNAVLGLSPKGKGE